MMSKSEKTCRYFLQIAYKGTHYHGWQQQQNAPTIQGVLQACLYQVLRRKVSVVGSSRTDTGVHAQQQFAHVDLAYTIDVNRLCDRLNALLPPDIVVVDSRLVRPHAHARFDALSRTYTYTIVRSKDPFQYARCYWFRAALDVSKMNEAASILCKKHRFQGLCKVRPTDKHFLCTIMAANWRLQATKLIFRIKANRFLRSMVRVIVGLLLKVGQHTLSLSAFEALIEQRDPRYVVGLAPASGLTLEQVAYPTTIFLPEKSILSLHNYA